MSQKPDTQPRRVSVGVLPSNRRNRSAGRPSPLHPHQRRHHGGVELGPGVARHLFQGDLRGNAAPVAPTPAHRVEGVGREGYACHERYLRAPQAVGVTLAVEPLVVVPHRRERRRQLLDGAQDFGAKYRMLPHGPVLLGGQGSRFLQDGVGDRDLSNVVQQGPNGDGAHLLSRESHPKGDAPGQLGHGLECSARWGSRAAIASMSAWTAWVVRTPIRGPFAASIRAPAGSPRIRSGRFSASRSALAAMARDWSGSTPTPGPIATKPTERVARRLRDQPPQPARVPFGLALVVPQQNDESLPSAAEDAPPPVAPQILSEPLEQGVPRRGTVRPVVAVETVQLDRHHRQGGPRGQLAPEDAAEGGAVGSPERSCRRSSSRRANASFRPVYRLLPSDHQGHDVIRHVERMLYHARHQDADRALELLDECVPSYSTAGAPSWQRSRPPCRFGGP